jgi:large subunit ribosomal protein L4
MDAIVYNQKGQESGTITLPETVFGVKWNADLVHQVATSLASSVRSNTAHTKNRGEVRGGGKKPWRQKGTGRARHGSIRSPLWVGGGVAHGPRNERNYARAVSKQTKRAALLSVLSAKYSEGEVLFLNALSIPEIKTKEAKNILSGLSTVKGFEAIQNKKVNAALILMPTKEKTAELSFRNLRNVKMCEARNLNLLDLLTFKHLVIVGPGEFLKLNTREST